MTLQTDQNIWKSKNTAHIAKVGMQAGFAIAAIAIAATIIYAAAKGIALSSVLPAFLANPWVIATIAFAAAMYFIATAISSYQQMYAMEEIKGQDGANGKDADFAALVDDVIKKGKIVEDNGKLNLKLSDADYKALINGKEAEVILHVLLAGKSVEVKFEHVDAANDNGNYKVVLTSPTNKKELGMAEDAKSLEVAVSNKNLEALKEGVATKLGEVAVSGAVAKITAKAA